MSKELIEYLKRADNFLKDPVFNYEGIVSDYIGRKFFSINWDTKALKKSKLIGDGIIIGYELQVWLHYGVPGIICCWFENEYKKERPGEGFEIIAGRKKPYNFKFGGY